MDPTRESHKGLFNRIRMRATAYRYISSIIRNHIKRIGKATDHNRHEMNTVRDKIDRSTNLNLINTKNSLQDNSSISSIKEVIAGNMKSLAKMPDKHKPIIQEHPINRLNTPISNHITNHPINQATDNHQ